MTDLITPAQLDCPPPTLTRRQAVAGAAIGLGALALPTAASAASGIGSALFSPSYGGTDGVVARWVGFNSQGSFPAGVAGNTYGGTHFLNRITDLTLGGTTISESQNSNLANPEISVDNSGGSGDTGFASFRVRNSSSTLDLSTSPYLQFRTAPALGTMNVQSFVLYAARNLRLDGPDMPLNLAFYVSTNDFATATLRRTASLPHNSTSHVVVSLGIGSTTLVANQYVAVRVYPYGTSSTRELRLRAFNGDGLPTALSSPTDAIDESRVGSRISTANDPTDASDSIAAFIGTYSS